MRVTEDPTVPARPHQVVTDLWEETLEEAAVGEVGSDPLSRLS